MFPKRVVQPGLLRGLGEGAPPRPWGSPRMHTPEPSLGVGKPTASSSSAPARLTSAPLRPALWLPGTRAHVVRKGRSRQPAPPSQESLPSPHSYLVLRQWNKKSKDPGCHLPPSPRRRMYHFLLETCRASASTLPLHLGTLSQPSAQGGRSEDTAARKEPTVSDQGAGWPEPTGSPAPRAVKPT